MPIPPRPEPNHASAVAKAGTERAPPISAAIGFSATTEIHAAPNETPRITSDRLAVIHDVLDSMLALVRAGTSVFLAVRYQHSHSCAARHFANVGIKGRLANMTFQWRFGFDIRFASPRLTA